MKGRGHMNLEDRRSTQKSGSIRKYYGENLLRGCTSSFGSLLTASPSLALPHSPQAPAVYSGVRPSASPSLCGAHTVGLLTDGKCLLPWACPLERGHDQEL